MQLPFKSTARYHAYIIFIQLYTYMDDHNIMILSFECDWAVFHVYYACSAKLKAIALNLTKINGHRKVLVIW